MPYKVPKKILVLSLLFLITLAFGQQNREFAEVKQHFDHQRTMLISEFEKKINLQNDQSSKEYIRSVFGEFMMKLDSVQNTAFVSALIKVKNREDLTAIHTGQVTKPLPPLLKASVPYPGGQAALHEQIERNFYSRFVNAPKQTLKAEVSFIIERDGSITSVKAVGENQAFNRQTEIAMYLIPDKFLPVIREGRHIRYRYQFPLIFDNN